MTDLCVLNYFLGISVTRDSSGMFLSQRKYAMEILERAHMVGCNPSRTLVDTKSKLGDGGTLVCLYVHDPREPHFSALKWILLDWAGCPTTRRSTSKYCVFLGNNLLSWSSKHIFTKSLPSALFDEFRDSLSVRCTLAPTAWEY
nr:ribonuclease H-like domain-containing protein [Tanacetum cinerariifolium]